MRPPPSARTARSSPLLTGTAKPYRARTAGLLLLCAPLLALLGAPATAQQPTPALAAPTAPAAATAWPAYMPGLSPALSESAVAAQLPPDVVITPPNAALPAGKARFSGVWQGSACMARACDIRIAVESVTATGATVVYAGANEQQPQVTDRTEASFVGRELQARLRTGARLVMRLREGLGESGEMEIAAWRPETQLLLAGVLSNRPIAPHYTRFVQRLPTPWVSDDGRAQTLEAVVYRPLDAKGPLPTVVFNHGSTGAGNRPAWFTFTWTSPEVAQYFTSKGWQVVFPQRRGRGKSDGLYDEGFGATRSAGYSCQPDRSLPGLDRAITDLDVVMSHLQQRPDVDKTRLLIGGVSRGGILSVAYAGTRPGMFLGVVNFVGGWLGDACREAGAAVNRTGFLRGAAFARPTLWLYGEHDSYYTLASSRASFEAFRAAGGHGSMVDYAPPQGQDGHGIHQYPALWQTDLDRYLAQVLPPATAAQSAAAPQSPSAPWRLQRDKSLQAAPQAPAPTATQPATRAGQRSRARTKPPHWRDRPSSGPHSFDASIGGAGQRVLNLFVQGRKVTVDRLPNDFKVHLEVAIRNSLAHLVSDRQRHSGCEAAKSGW